MVSAILVVTGALTVVVGVGLFVPRELLNVLLGYEPKDATTVLIGRHWSLLGALMGGLVIYAGLHPETRFAVLIAAASEKLTFGALIVASPLRRRPLTMVVACADALMALIYLLFLVQAGSG